jgi:hypothetical protein
MAQHTPHMPRMSSNEAPQWDGRGSTLRQYIWQVERLMEVCKITVDADKVNWLITYLPGPDYREEWLTFATAVNQDYDSFIARLKEEYPETVAYEQGSVRRLKALCKEYRGVHYDEEERLLAFKRRFTTEAAKCLKTPALVSN